jgi:hypothetical protein
VPGTGIELSALKPTKTTILRKSDAKCGAPDDKNDPDLCWLIERWPELAPELWAAILKMASSQPRPL